MKLVNYGLFAADLNKGGLAFAASHSAALGFQAVEFLDAGEPRARTVAQAREDRAILEKNGLSVACYSMFADLWNNEPDSILGALDYIAALGAPLFHHTLLPDFARTPASPTYEQALERILPRAEAVAKRANALGMTVIYEPQGLYFNGCEGLGRFIAEMKKNGCDVGFCADLGNPLFVDADPVAVLKHLIADVRHVHVKDYTLGDVEVSGLEGYWLENGKRLTVTELGTGVVDNPRGIECLRASGYDGTVALEFAASDEEMKRSKQYVQDLWKK